MTYAASYFRANMGEILDKTRFNRSITTIGRRKKTEFYIIPSEVWDEKKIGDNFNDFEIVTDKSIVNTINKVNGTNNTSITFG